MLVTTASAFAGPSAGEEKTTTTSPSRFDVLFEGLKRDAPVVNTGLSDIPLDNIGLYKNGPQLDHLWAGMDEGDIQDALSQLKPLSATPLVHNLKVMLLVNNIDLPATNRTDHALFILRIQQLMLMGEFEDAQQLLKRIPNYQNNVMLSQLQTEILLLQTRYREACEIIAQQFEHTPTLPFWRFASLACTLNNKDMDKAQLGYGLLEEDHLLPGGALGNVLEQAVFNKKKGIVLDADSSRSPLVLAFIGLGNIPVNVSHPETFPPAALMLITSTFTADPKTKITAGELLLGTGHYPPSSLLALYQALPNPAPAKKAKKQPTLDALSLRSQYAKRLAESLPPVESLRYIGKIYHDYRQAGLLWQGLTYIADRANDFQIDPPLPADVLPATAAIFRTLMLAQKDLQVSHWLDLVATQPLTGAISSDMAKLRIGAQAIQKPEGASVSTIDITTWEQWSHSLPTDQQQPYMRFIYQLLKALKTQIPGEAQNQTQTLDIASDTLITHDLDASFPLNFPAKTILLAINVMEQKPTPHHYPLALADIVKAFYAMGLKQEASELARIAIIYTSQTTID